MTEAYRNIMHRSKDAAASTTRSYHHQQQQQARYHRGSLIPASHQTANPSGYAPFHSAQGQQHPSSSDASAVTDETYDKPSISSTPLQTPIGQAPRSHNQQQDRNRKPYSEALAGSMTKTVGDSMQPSSSLATQVEPSSSSVNGDQPVRKCGVTDAATTTSTPVGGVMTPKAADEGISLFIKNLPIIPVNQPLERVRADLYALLSPVAQIDNVTVRYGRIPRYQQPYGPRKLLAFAHTTNLDEAKKLIACRSLMFMGCHLRVEMTLWQRTLIVRPSRENISLEPLRTMLPWSNEKQQRTLLQQQRKSDELIPFTQALVQELCSAFGLVSRLNSDRAPFEVIFADYEACRRARQVIGSVSVETGIVALLPSEHAQALLPRPRNESDVEFSSDCLPIITSSSSLGELSMVDKKAKERSGSFVSSTPLPGNGANRAAPQSPETEVATTPALSNASSGSDVEDREHDHPSPGPGSVLPIDGLKIKEAKREQMQKRPVEIDTYGIFVSRIPTVDNLEELLRGHFSQDGPIKDLRVLPPKSSHQSRIAFVTFEDSASAQRALSRPGRLFLGSRLNVRQKEHKELGQHFHQRQYGSKTLMTVNGGVSANNEGTPQGEMAGGENMHPTACAVPSMTIRFGSGPASPEVTLGQTNRPCYPSSPSKQRGASLPSRPAQWSPSKDTWTSASDLSSPSHPAVEGVPTESAAYQQSACSPDARNSMCVPPMMPVQWPGPPLSPFSATTQPSTAAQSPVQGFKLAPLSGHYDQYSNDGSPTKNSSNREQQAGAANWMHGQGGMMMMGPSIMQGGEYGAAPYWPMITVDPSGQRYVVHPVGSYCQCPSMMPPFAHHHQHQEVEQHHDQGNAHFGCDNPYWQGDQVPSSKDEQQDGAQAAEIFPIRPPLVVLPHCISMAPPYNPSPWTMQPGPFTDQRAMFARSMSAEGLKQGQGAYPSQENHGYDPSLGPIQIPAWMNDSC